MIYLVVVWFDRATATAAVNISRAMLTEPATLLYLPLYTYVYCLLKYYRKKVTVISCSLSTF